MAALDRETLVAGLDGLGVTPVELKHAFLQLCVQDAGVADISLLRKYKHLQVVDMSRNQIVDTAPLEALAHLRSLNLSHNKVTSVLDFEPEPMEDNFADHEFRVCVGSSLDDADLSHNSIEVMNSIAHHRFLRRLVLAHNTISRIAGINTLAHLQTLDLSNNRIQRIDGLDNLPLKHLDLSHNQITKLQNVHTLVQLQVLNVSSNRIASLSGLQRCKALNVLDASNNNIDNIHEVHHLGDLPLLSRLSLRGNAVTDTMHYRLRVVVYTRSKLEFLDHLATSAEEKVKGANMFGADAEHRRVVHETHVEEEPFINYMPPFEDDEAKKAATLQAAEAEASTDDYTARLYEDVAASSTPQYAHAAALVSEVIGETMEQLASGAIQVQRFS